MKKFLPVLILFLFFALPISALEVLVDSSYSPDSLVVSWIPEEGSKAETITIACPGMETVEVPYSQKEVVIGGPDKPLWPETKYEIIVSEAGKNGKKLDSVTVEATTGTWAGTYAWINPTDNNNKGRCTEIVFKAVSTKSGTNVFYSFYCFSPDQKLLRIFPIDYPGSDGSYEWHDYDLESDQGLAYRTNAEAFNKTSFTPSKWKVEKVLLAPAWAYCQVKTKALGFSITAENTYTFRTNHQTGKKELLFFIDGNGIAATGLFFNPQPGEEGKKVFVLEQI